MSAPELSIYIVDDDAAVRAALQLLVRSFGWRARTFASGAEFLDQPEPSGPACLVLDLSMPGMDGEEVLRRLRARGSRLPVILMTGDREGGRLQRAAQIGARQVLLKPFDDRAFHAAVESCEPGAATA